MSESYKSSAEILRACGIEPDPVIEAYKKDLDRTLLEANLLLTPEERSQKFEAFMTFIEEIRGSARQSSR
jgi:hypothetical protein